MMTSFAWGRKQTKESTNPLCPFSARHSIPIYSLPSPQRGISLQIAENIEKENMAKKFDRNFFACKFLKTFENNTQTQSNQNSLPFSFFFWRKWWNWYITFLLQSETSLPSSFGFHERIYLCFLKRSFMFFLMSLIVWEAFFYFHKYLWSIGIFLACFSLSISVLANLWSSTSDGFSHLLIKFSNTFHLRKSVFFHRWDWRVKKF